MNFNCQLTTNISLTSYSLDGWYNNVENPSFGGIGAALKRYGPPESPSNPAVTNVFNLTNHLFYTTNGTQLNNKSGKVDVFSALLVYFSQFVLMDIMDFSASACPRGYVKISDVSSSPFNREEAAGSWLKKSERSFVDTDSCQANWFWRRSVAEQPNNWATAYLDCSQIYGVSSQTLKKLRAYEYGKFGKCGAMRGSCAVDPAVVKDAYETADIPFDFPTLPSSKFINAMRVTWMSWHNYIADAIYMHNNSLSDDAIFKEARLVPFTFFLIFITTYIVFS